MTFYINPYRRIAGLRREMDRMIDETLTESTNNEREMVLAVDVQANDETYQINALIPGLDAEGVEIEILNNTVTIRGEFKSHANEELKYLLSELPTGNFSRVITLPTTLDTSKAEAHAKNGLLTLTIPKAEAHRPKTIHIKSE